VADRNADIFFKDQLAGTLAETAGAGTRFTYNEGWKTPIACCLPVARREHEWPQGVHPFFQHLAPEGWLREQQARGAHVAEQDDFGLLLRYGADCIGAVGVRPPAGAKIEDLPGANEVTASPGRTISGIQKKLLVVKESGKAEFRPAAATGPAPYIAKFNSERHATLVRNENLSLLWSAAVLGAAEVNAFTIGRVSVLNETALIVTRFDRTAEGQKLQLEDFAQILCKPRGRDFSGKYDASYEDVAEVIRTHSARAGIDLARFLRRLIVFVLIGNCDAHLKNFSLLETPDGLRLSPAYDIVNTAFYEGYDQNLALSIGGAKFHLDQVTRQILEGFGLSIGLPQPAITEILDNLRTRVKRAEGLLTPPAGEPPDGFVTRFSEIVSRACLRIFEE
jgi:serine/threonine-protein kinase HipA